LPHATQRIGVSCCHRGFVREAGRPPNAGDKTALIWQRLLLFACY
jgi:hypothetical protein